ncbi:MAG: cupin domain-containing protein [Bacteroidota bacterium]
MKKENISDISGLENSSVEVFQTLADGSSLIERIISNGQTTPEGAWYDQPLDEWVLLLQGEASLEFEDRNTIHLYKGDYILIKSHQKHRVTYTSPQPPCIWLAIHGKFS